MDQDSLQKGSLPLERYVGAASSYIIMSILFHHYKELKQSISEVEQIEEANRASDSKKKEWLTEKEEEKLEEEETQQQEKKEERMPTNNNMMAILLLASVMMLVGGLVVIPALEEPAEAKEFKYCTSSIPQFEGELIKTACFKTIDECEQAREGFINPHTPCSKVNKAK